MRLLERSDRPVVLLLRLARSVRADCGPTRIRAGWTESCPPTRSPCRIVFATVSIRQIVGEGRLAGIELVRLLERRDRPVVLLLVLRDQSALIVGQRRTRAGWLGSCPPTRSPCRIAFASGKHPPDCRGRPARVGSSSCAFSNAAIALVLLPVLRDQPALIVRPCIVRLDGQRLVHPLARLFVLLLAGGTHPPDCSRTQARWDRARVPSRTRRLPGRTASRSLRDQSALIVRPGIVRLDRQRLVHPLASPYRSPFADGTHPSDCSRTPARWARVRVPFRTRRSPGRTASASCAISPR